MPVSIKYNYADFNPSIDVFYIWTVAIFLCCQIWSTECEIIFYPPFQPNDYLYETHFDKIESNTTSSEATKRNTKVKASDLT